jgi:hypothetical protein
MSVWLRFSWCLLRQVFVDEIQNSSVSFSVLALSASTGRAERSGALNIAVTSAITLGQQQMVVYLSLGVMIVSVTDRTPHSTGSW